MDIKGGIKQYLVSTTGRRGIGDVNLHPGVLLGVVEEQVVVQASLEIRGHSA